MSKDFIWLQLQKKWKPANKGVYRLFLIGQKQMPEIVEGKTNSKKGIGH